MLRIRKFLPFRAMLFAAYSAIVAILILPENGTAGSKEDVFPAPQGTTQATSDMNALQLCATLTAPDGPGINRASLSPQLRDPKNRIEGQDWTGQNLAGKNLSGKVLINVKLNGANLRGADLTGSIICNSDLTDVDLTGASLERTLVGGDTELNGANLTQASAIALNIADASGTIRIDGATLRGANLICEPGDFVPCLGHHISIVSMFGADLRGATIDHLCCSAFGLGTARLGGVTTHLNGYGDMDFAQLATSVAESERIVLIPDYGFSGHRTEFSGVELRQVAAVVNRMRIASARPSFDCSRAGTKVEKAICSDPKLAALDRALAWLWERVEHTAPQTAAQKKWLSTRADCPPVEDSRGSLKPAVNRPGCIGLAYAERIKQLAPVSTAAAIGSATYTTDPPLEVPQDNTAPLAEKLLDARGLRLDAITIKNLGNGAGQISGYGAWANGHECGFEASEAKTERVGAQFRIADGSAGPRDDNDSISFVITPWVVIRVGGNSQFQCGARGGWSDAYFSQPDRLVSKADGLTGQ